MAKRPGDSTARRLNDLKKQIGDVMERSESLRRQLSADMRWQRLRDLPIKSPDAPSKKRS